jgi:hypothetical protein
MARLNAIAARAVPLSSDCIGSRVYARDRVAPEVPTIFPRTPNSGDVLTRLRIGFEQTEVGNPVGRRMPLRHPLMGHVGIVVQSR